MATLHKVCQDVKTKEIDLAKVLNRLFYDLVGGNHETLSVDNVMIQLRASTSLFRQKFLREEGFQGGNLEFNVAELGQALNLLIKDGVLQMVIQEYEDRSSQIRFRKVD